MALPSDLYTVSVTGSFKDAGGATLPGTVTFTLSTLLADGTGNVVIPAYPKPYTLSAGSLTAGPLVANDNADLLPTGSTYLVTVALQNMQQYSYSVQLLAAPFTFTATNATPCVFSAAGSSYANGTAVTLTGGSLPTGFTAATTYFVVSASGTSFSLAATSGGSAIASTGTGSGTVSTASVDLADLQPVVPQGTPVSYVPTSGGTYTGTVVLDGSPALQIPSGAAAGQVLTSDASGNGVWAAPALVVKPEVQEATAAALPANAYLSGVLTASSNGALTVDGIAVTAGDRVLVKNEATAANNGVYVATSAGSAGTRYVLTRSADMNTAADIPGAFVFAEAGNANFQTGWMVTGSGPWTLGSTAINWVKFSAAPAAALLPTAVKTSAYTAAGGDYVLADTQTTGAFTVTLPTAPPDKTTIGVKMVKQAGTNAVTIARGGSDTFNDDASTSAALVLLNQSAIFQYDAALTAWIKVSSDTPLAQLDARYGGAGTLTWNAKLNGLACDGSTDDTAALNTLLATVTSAGGGTIFFPALAKISSQLVLPSAVSGSQLRQAPIRLQGTMPSRPGETETGVAYSTGGLDLRYAGRTDTGCGTTLGSNVVTDASAASGDYGQIIISPGNLPDRTCIMAVTPGVGYSLNNGARATNASASFTIGGGKIETHGIGTLELDHMLICDQGTSSQPFILSTGTTVQVHDCAILGNTSKASGTCDQDVFVAGGPGQGTALTSALTSGNVYTSLAVSALPVALLSSSAALNIFITNGTNTQQVGCSATSAGATSITVPSFTANANYGIGSSVVFAGQQSALGATAYTVPAAPFQGYGSHLHDNFFDRCRRVLLQTWASDVYLDTNEWWQNCGSNLAVTPSTLTSGLTLGSNYTSLTVSALAAAVNTGDQIELISGVFGLTNTQVATASAPAAASATSISVNSFTANFSYPTTTKVFSPTAGIGAAVEVYGVAANVSQVNATSNRIEFSGAYSYAFRLGGTNAFESVIIGNNQQDANAANIAAYRFDPGCTYNLLIPGLTAATTVPMLDDQSITATYGGGQVVLKPQQSQPSNFSQGLTTRGQLSIMTDGNLPYVFDSSGNMWQHVMTTSSWFLHYTPAGGSVQPVARFTSNSGTSVTWTVESAITTLLINGPGTVNLRSGAGSPLNFGDPTRQTDVSVQNGNLSVTHLLAIGTAPTVATASSSTSLSIAGQDTAHNVALTTAASIGAGSSVATITFGLGYATRGPNTTPRFAVTPKNQASATAQPYVTGDSQTGYAIALANPPAGATAMVFDVHVLGS